MGGYLGRGGTSATAAAGTPTVTSTAPSGTQAADAVLATIGNIASGARVYLDDATLTAGQIKLNAARTQLLAATSLAVGNVPYGVLQSKVGLVTSPAATGNIVIASTVAVPTNTVPPSIAGNATLGSTVTPVTGTYTGSPTKTGRLVRLGSPEVFLTATGNLTPYTLVAADIGKSLAYEEYAENAANPGSPLVTRSAAFGPVGSAPTLWFNMRQTAVYVTDGANEDNYLGEPYGTRTSNGRAIGSWSTTVNAPSTANTASNRSTIRGSHLAGYVSLSSSTALALRLDIGPGRYRLRCALGTGTVSGLTAALRIRDNTTGLPVIASIPAATSTLAASWLDTSGTFKDVTTWRADNETGSAVYLEFVTTTGELLIDGGGGAALSMQSLGFEYRSAS